MTGNISAPSAKRRPPNVITAASLPFTVLKMGPATQPLQPLDPVDGLKLNLGPSKPSQPSQKQELWIWFPSYKPEAQLPAPGAPETAGAQARKREFS